MPEDSPLSQRARAIQPSSTLAIGAEAARLIAEGRDVINLCPGEPDFDTPEHIRAAGARAMDEGLTRYTHVAGIAALREAVSAKFRRENNLEYDPGQVLVSCGCKHSLYNLFQAILDPGDEVIIPAPYWTSYPEIVLLAGGQPMILYAGAQHGFKLSAERLSQALGRRTRAVLINSPNNPSGACYTRDELRALADVLLEHEDVIVISDDIYEHISWGAEAFCNILNVEPSLSERTVVCNGVSKAYAMTGWRIGYAAGPKPIIAAMTRIQSHSTSNPATISQAAAVAALQDSQEQVTEFCATFKKRHDYVHGRLVKMPGVHCLPSTGTFYLFPDFSAAMERCGVDDDIAFARMLLSEARLATVPGSAFGAQGHQRVSFATGVETLTEAMDRLEEVLVAGAGGTTTTGLKTG